MRKHSVEAPRLRDAHDHHEGLSRRSAAWIVGAQALAATTQLAVAGFQLASKGFLEGIQALNPATAMDAVHNIGDAAGWAGHALLEGKNFLTEDPRKQQRLRLGTYATISTMGDVSMVEGTRSLISGTHEYTQNIMNMGGGVVSLGAAALTAAITHASLKRKGYTRLRDVWKSHSDKKMAIHSISDAATASASFASTLPNMPHSVASVASIVGGATLAYTFRWTKENLQDTEHHCAVHGGHESHDHHHGHDHAHDHDHHSHSHSRHHEPHEHMHGPVTVQELLPGYSKKSWFEQLRTPGRHRQEKRGSWWRKSVAIGSMAVAACIGSSGTVNEVPLSAPPATIQQGIPPLPEMDIRQTMVQLGDSQWSIARSEITKVTGIADPQERHVYEVTQQMIHDNSVTHPNPHTIYPGEMLAIPDSGAIYATVSR